MSEKESKQDKISKLNISRKKFYHARFLLIEKTTGANFVDYVKLVVFA